MNGYGIASISILALSVVIIVGTVRINRRINRAVQRINAARIEIDESNMRLTAIRKERDQLRDRA